MIRSSSRSKMPPRRATIKGQKHRLAYINDDEMELLRHLGGGEEDDGSQMLGPAGVPAFANTLGGGDDWGNDRERGRFDRNLSDRHQAEARGGAYDSPQAKYNRWVKSASWLERNLIPSWGSAGFLPGPASGPVGPIMRGVQGLQDLGIIGYGDPGSGAPHGSLLGRDSEDGSDFAGYNARGISGDNYFDSLIGGLRGPIGSAGDGVSLSKIRDYQRRNNLNDQQFGAWLTSKGIPYAPGFFGGSGSPAPTNTPTTQVPTAPGAQPGTLPNGGIGAGIPGGSPAPNAPTGGASSPGSGAGNGNAPNYNDGNQSSYITGKGYGYRPNSYRRNALGRYYYGF